MRDYTGNDNYGRPKSAYLNYLKMLKDDDLFKLIENVVWLSAFANNNPRSDYHWQADACYDEASRRGKPDLYKQAYRHAYKSAIGTDPYPGEGDADYELED